MKPPPMEPGRAAPGRLSAKSERAPRVRAPRQRSAARHSAARGTICASRGVLSWIGHGRSAKDDEDKEGQQGQFTHRRTQY